MGQNFRYELFQEGQENAVSDLVCTVFTEFEAPYYTDEGISVFKKFILPETLVNKVKNEGFRIYCCFDRNKLVGVLAFRDINHISLLFVMKEYHQKGIAKELLKMAINEIHKTKNKEFEITVNSSPYAVKIYERLGFISTNSLQETNGIK